MATFDTTLKTANPDLVQRIGLGTAAFGQDLPVLAAHAEETIETAWAAGIRYFDTAHLYGGGLAEQRLGRALNGKPRDSYRLSTKIGQYRPFGEPAIPPGKTQRRANDVWDYGFDRTLAAVETSLKRLNTDRIDIVFLHGFDNHLDQALDEARAALARLKGEGVIGAIGGGCDTTAPLIEGLSRDALDVVLSAGRYSLLDQSAIEQLMPMAIEKDARIIAAGVFNSGILATGAVAGAQYDYLPATQAVLDRARTLDALCRDHGVPMKTAALQFALHNGDVSAMLLGAGNVAELDDCLAQLRMPIPPEFWAAANGLFPAGSP